MLFDQRLPIPLFVINCDKYQCILIINFKMTNCDVRVNISKKKNQKKKNTPRLAREFLSYIIKENTDISAHFRCV